MSVSQRDMPASSLKRGKTTVSSDIAVATQQRKEICHVVGKIADEWEQARYKEAQGLLYDAYVSLMQASKGFEVLLATTSSKRIIDCKEFNRLPGKTSNNVILILNRFQAELNRLYPLIKEKIIRCNASETDYASESEAEQFARKTVVQFNPGSSACKLWFESIVGLERVKEKLQIGIINGMLYPKLVWPVNNSYLLYGLPGTGKTILAKAVVNELRSQSADNFDVFFFAPKSSDLKGGLVGETEKKIGDIFDGASSIAYRNSARSGKPSISVVFIDEIDSIAPTGRGEAGPMAQITASSVNTLLQVMDGIQKSDNVMLLAATNFPDTIDSAVLRRFNDLLHIDLPTASNVSSLINLRLSDYISMTLESDQTLSNYTSKTPPIMRYTSGACKKTTAVDAGNTCKRPSLTIENRWQKSVAAEYISIGLTPSAIATVSARAADKNMSGADIDRIFRRFIAHAGNMTINDGRFYEKEIEVEQPELCDTANPTHTKLTRKLFFSSLTLFRDKAFEEKQPALTLYTIKPPPPWGQVTIGNETYTQYQASHKYVIPFTETEFDDLYFKFDEKKNQITLLFDKKIVVRQKLTDKTRKNAVVPLIAQSEIDIYDALEKDSSIKKQYYRQGEAIYHYFVKTIPIDMKSDSGVKEKRSLIGWLLLAITTDTSISASTYDQILNEKEKEKKHKYSDDYVLENSNIPLWMVASISFGGYGKVTTYKSGTELGWDETDEWHIPKKMEYTTIEPLYSHEGITFLERRSETMDTGSGKSEKLEMIPPSKVTLVGGTAADIESPFGKFIDSQQVRVDMVNWYLPAYDLIRMFTQEASTITLDDKTKMEKYNKTRTL